MNLNHLAKKVKNNEFAKYISCDLQDYINSIDECELENSFKRVMKSPITYTNQFDKQLYQLYFAVAWSNLFFYFLTNKNVNLLEVASGDANYILNGLDHYSGDLGTYVTFNLNKKLSSNIINKNITKSVKIEVVEDDGNKVLNYYDEKTFDVVGYHHALNDIIQTIVAEAEGIDTVNCDWWEKEPEMLRAVLKHHNQGTLKTIAYDNFISLIKVCCQSLKDGGYMIFDNCSFAGYESMGYSTKFHDSYINLARQWIIEAQLPLHEIKVDGYDSKWWLILIKR